MPIQMAASLRAWKRLAVVESIGKHTAAKVVNSEAFTLERTNTWIWNFLHTAAKQLSVVSLIPTHAGPDPPVDPINQRKDLHPLTKFFIPSLTPNVYHRPRLFEPFRDLSKSVIWVTAPPYYGKTTLVVDWISIDQPSVAWVSLDERDNDARPFLVVYRNEFGFHPKRTGSGAAFH